MCTFEELGTEGAQVLVQAGTSPGLRAAQPRNVRDVPGQGLVADYYRDLAVDYDWLHDDDALTDGIAITRPAVAGLLRRLGPGSHGSTRLAASG